jgi:hypothetical protein
MQMTRSLLAAVLVAAGLAGGMLSAAPGRERAAQADGQTPTFTTGVDVVQVDVTVLDGKDQPVHGLTAADFSLKENGTPQRIVAVQEVVVPDDVSTPVWLRTTPGDLASNDVNGRRIFALYIDANIYCTGASRVAVPLPPMQGRANTWQTGDPSRPRPCPAANSELRENVWLIARTIVDRLVPGDVGCLIVPGAPLRRQPCTADLARLSEAVDRLKASAVLESLPSTLDDLPPVISGPPLRTLAEVARYLSAVPMRRKALVVIGGQRRIIDGRGTIDADLLDVIRYASLANVNIYAIFPGTGSARTGVRQDLLDALAENTGGLALLGPAAVDAGLDRMFAANSAYYIVGYQTDDPASDGKVRTLDVRVTNHGRLSVRSRRQIVRPKLERSDGSTSAVSVSNGLSPQLAGLLPNIDVTLDVLTIPFQPMTSGLVAVPIVVGLTEPVPLGATRIVQTMDVTLTAYDERGTIAAQRAEHERVDMAPGAENRVRYEIFSQLDLRPGLYTMRVVAHNPDTGKLGVMNLDVTVPDFAARRVSLSAIGLARAASTDTPPPVAGRSILPLPATTIRAFLRDESVTAFARVYERAEAADVPVRVDARLLDGEGAVVAADARDFTPGACGGNGGCEWRWRLPIEGFAPGMYLLTVEASSGPVRAPRHDVPLTVR